MKAWFNRYAARLDALSERERIAVFAAGAALIVFVLYLIFIAPELERRTVLAARMADQDKQMSAALAQQQELVRMLGQDPDIAVRERVAQKERQIAEIDSQLAGLQRTLVAPERMPVLLQQLVGQGQGVQLVSLRNLPAVPIGQGATQPAKAPAKEPGRPAAREVDRHVYKHGVEIVVQGSYFDLLDYVARLEKQPWQVYWGRTVMAAEYPKVVVTLTLYTLSLDKSWLVV